jgi:hypothetical protein
MFRRVWHDRIDMYDKCYALTWHGFTVEEVVNNHPDLENWDVKIV